MGVHMHTYTCLYEHTLHATTYIHKIIVIVLYTLSRLRIL